MPNKDLIYLTLVRDDPMQSDCSTYVNELKEQFLCLLKTEACAGEISQKLHVYTYLQEVRNFFLNQECD